MKSPTKETVDPNDRGACEATALRILNGAGQSRAGLVRRLERRGFNSDIADDVATQLMDSGWIDDSKLATEITAKRNRTGYGRRRIAADLMSRRVSEAAIGNALSAMDSNSELESARTAAEKLRRRFPEGHLEEADVRRFAAALQRRGFSFDVIRSVLREFS